MTQNISEHALYQNTKYIRTHIFSEQTICQNAKNAKTIKQGTSEDRRTNSPLSPKQRVIFFTPWQEEENEEEDKQEQ